jgi:sporulation protein YlmC with PRC-barrel domain
MSGLKSFTAILIASAAICWVTAPGAAQVVGDADAPQRPAEQPTTPAEKANMVHRAEDIIGMDVKNQAGEDLGSVNDLVMGMRSGEMRYAALSIGGFLGIGDKLIAVPFQSLSVKSDPDDADEKFIVVNIDEAKLKGVEGFDQDSWPDMANPRWGADIDRHFGVERAGDANARAEAPADQNPEQPATDVAAQERDPAYRVSAIQGMDVKNAANEDLGEIEDLMIDCESGKVHYAALAFGQTLGAGGKLFAVPWDRFTLHQATGEDRFLLFDATREELQTAEGFNDEKWPDAPAQRWAEAPSTTDGTRRE